MTSKQVGLRRGAGEGGGGVGASRASLTKRNRETRYFWKKAPVIASSLTASPLVYITDRSDQLNLSGKLLV